MEFEDIEEDISRPHISSTILVALAVLGIILGGVSLFFGFSVNKRLRLVEDSMQASTSSSAQIETSISRLEAHVAELEAKTASLLNSLNRMRTYSSQTERAVKELVTELNTNREKIVQVARKVNEVSASVAPATTKPKASKNQPADASESDEMSAVPLGTARTYLIRSGDNFSSIATKFGVSVQSILDANPYADPRRLSIGQEIIIPAE